MFPSTCYTALQTKNSTRNFSAMNPVTTENASKKPDTARGKPYLAIANQHLTLSVKRNAWNTKEDKGKSTIQALYVLQLAKRHVSGLKQR